MKIYAIEGSSLEERYVGNPPSPTPSHLDMQGIGRPYSNDVAVKDLFAGAGFGKWEPANATTSIAADNKAEAKRLLSERAQEYIFDHGVNWHGDRSSFDNMELAVKRNDRANYPPTKTKEWRMPDGSKRLTKISELDSVMGLWLERFELANDSYNLWLDTDRQSPWVYP